MSEEHNWEDWPGFEASNDVWMEVQPRESETILIDQRK